MQTASVLVSLCLKWHFLFKLHNLILTELTSFKGRRVVAFRKNFIEMAELEIKHAKVSSKVKEDAYVLASFPFNAPRDKWQNFNKDKYLSKKKKKKSYK